MIIPLCIFILKSMYIRLLFPTLMSYVPKLYPKLVKTFCCCFLQEVPEIPGNFDLVGHSSRQANLSWNLPYDGQSPLLAFQLEFQRTNAGKGGIYLVVKYIHTIINTYIHSYYYFICSNSILQSANELEWFPKFLSAIAGSGADLFLIYSFSYK